ncbi:hypothetical protein LJC56_10070 [Christensenellaceae bacterium OttesenSCG-928-K19]|nr:hypothetical protein [Christensenellaceae bacterium OttesenSCG-928-K19]
MKFYVIATLIAAGSVIAGVVSAIVCGMPGLFDGRVPAIAMIIFLAYVWAGWMKERRESRRRDTPEKKRPSLNFYYDEKRR